MNRWTYKKKDAWVLHQLLNQIQKICSEGATAEELSLEQWHQVGGREGEFEHSSKMNGQRNEWFTWTIPKGGVIGQQE